MTANRLLLVTVGVTKGVCQFGEVPPFLCLVLGSCLNESLRVSLNDIGR
jgi:hypothetical protein